MTLKFPIYLDNQATTPLDPRVLETMLPFMSGKFGNPHSTTHSYGWEGAAAIDVAREKIASLIGAGPEEIIFTSGATEANNLAIKGIFRTFKGKKDRIITANTEHSCVLESAAAIAADGADVISLGVGKDGLISLEGLEKNLTDETALVSIMAVNNEIGVIQPLEEIGKLCRNKGVLFHSDAAQAFGKIPLNVGDMNIDLMSLSAHKIYGPKGVGALYVRKKVQRLLTPHMAGGGQERGIRSGTLSPALCVGFGMAAEIAAAEMDAELKRMAAMSAKFLGTLREVLSNATLNGSGKARWPGNLNLTFPGINGDLLISNLKNIAISSGAACASAVEGPSYVLEALGVSEADASSSLRIGFGRFTSEEEASYAAEYLRKTVGDLS